MKLYNIFELAIIVGKELGLNVYFVENNVYSPTPQLKIIGNTANVQFLENFIETLALSNYRK